VKMAKEFNEENISEDFDEDGLDDLELDED